MFEDKLLSNPDKKVFHYFLEKVIIEMFKDALKVYEEEVLKDLLFCDFQRNDNYDAYDILVKLASFVYETYMSV